MDASRRHHAQWPPRPGGVLALLLLLPCHPAVGAGATEPSSGREVYLRLCTDCHGRDGEGVPGKYSSPLGGDRTLERLRKIIVDTMPEDDPDLCVGEEAEAVARYLHKNFYAEAPMPRESQARVELVRLTNRQYAQAVADLLADPDGPATKPSRFGGLTAAYYKSSNFRWENRIHERLDSRIEFDFGEAAPDADGIPSDEFSIRWRGSLWVPDTGEYEFILRTPNGARLWVNDEDEPLIDASVASGGQEESRSSLKLLGGRVYPLRLDFFKSKDKRAAIGLEWIPPHGTREIIPARCLSPNEVRPTFVVNTPFPPDDASVGYERGVSVSPAWEEATTHAAIELAHQVVRRLDTLARVGGSGENRDEKIFRFCSQFVETAFRRPLTPEQARFFVQDQFEAAASVEAAVKRVVVLTLKSPRFLYLGLDARQPDDYEVATRLSFGLWDSLPDGELLRLAGQGELSDPERVRAQARRMLEDPRARSKVRDSLHHWLQMDHADNLAKDPQLYPEFTPRLIADLRISLDLFLESAIWGERADYRELLLADYLYLNPSLAQFYGVASPVEEEFGKVPVEAQLRAGVLTHPYLLAVFAYPRTTSPIHRGVFLTRNIVGRGLKPPPVAVAFKDAEFDPTLSMREKVETLTRPEACQACHATINPLGFSLEHYDAVGRFRTTDGDRPVHAVSDYLTADGETIRLADARDLARHAVASTSAHRAFVEQLFHQIVKQPVRAYGTDALERLGASFADADFNVQDLMIEIATLAALHQVEPRANEPPPGATALLQLQHSPPSKLQAPNVERRTPISRLPSPVSQTPPHPAHERP